MKKIIICIFMIFISSKSTFAYETLVTKLSDESYYPLYHPDQPTISSYVLKEHIVFDGDIDNLRKMRENEPNIMIEQIATITFKFEIDEIGTDTEAVIILARKECGKMGADWVFSQSLRLYSDPVSIRSVTFRCVRSQEADHIEKSYKPLLEEGKMKNEIESSIFLSRLKLEIYSFPIDEFWLPLSELMKYPERVNFSEIGILIKHIEDKDNASKRVFIDIKTGNELDEQEIQERINGKHFKEYNDWADRIIAVYKNNLPIYRDEYEKILNFMQKYPDSFLNRFFPEINSDGNIDYQKFKNDIIPDQIKKDRNLSEVKPK